MKLFSILSFLLISIISSCSFSKGPKCEQKTYVENLPSFYFDNIPYNGSDTLIFINKKDSEVLTFVGIGLDSGYTLSSYNDNYDCPSNPLKLAYRDYIFESGKDSKIQLRIFINNKMAGMFAINFEGQKFDGNLSLLGPNYIYNNLIIENKSYININRIGHDSNVLDTSYYVLMNKEFGILQFKFPDNTYWNLVEKK